MFVSLGLFFLFITADNWTILSLLSPQLHWKWKWGTQLQLGKWERVKYLYVKYQILQQKTEKKEVFKEKPCWHSFSFNGISFHQNI